MNNDDRIMGSGLRAGDYYAQQSAQALREMNRRARNGGRTDGEMLIGGLIQIFRALPKPVRRIVLALIVLVIGLMVLAHYMAPAVQPH
jgi:hypothetical protein